ncbi:hypothetical protein SteCoe_34882 [Stentor coeruleus]|uniref:EF-hand domain-containing protein n=1 Tax=Stentor coeruleus TaxID=5963 RepID=A0A1R2ATK0_9CILI|nr:hypothetical protein SteCoe_34882 [Stentor coeruleus]
MGSGIKDWWIGDYPQMSIKNYKKMPVYMRFMKIEKPFSRQMKLFREAFWEIDNCDIYEWYDKAKETGEKFGHDRNSNTYFYELWWIEEEEQVRRVRKVWLNGSLEWGVNIRYLPEYEEITSWNIDSEKKCVEIKTKYPTHEEGKRIGTEVTPDGEEDFEERFWESADRFRNEKEWKNPLGQGIDKTFKEGGKSWGESEGQKNDEDWKDNWEKDSTGSFEESQHQNPTKKWGNLRSRKGDNKYTVNWEGEKPNVNGENPDASDLEKKNGLISLEKINSELLALYQNLKENFENKVNRNDFSDATPESKAEFEEIKKDIDGLSDPSELDPNDSISAIRHLEIMRERLDLAIEKRSPREKLFKKAMCQSLATLEELKFHESPALGEEILSKTKQISEISNETLNLIEQSPQTHSSLKNIEELLINLEQLKREMLLKLQESLDIEKALKNKLLKSQEENPLARALNGLFDENASDEDKKKATELINYCRNEGLKDQNSTKKSFETLLEGSQNEATKEKSEDLIKNGTEIFTNKNLQNLDFVGKVLQDFLPIRAEESEKLDSLLNSSGAGGFSKDQATEFLEKIKEDQENTKKALEILAKALGNNEDKQLSSELIDRGIKLTENPEKPNPKTIFENYFPLRAEESALISNLIEKAQDMLHDPQDTYEKVWKALLLSDEISEALIGKKDCEEHKTLNKELEGLPGRPVLDIMHILLIKYQEFNLGLIIGDKNHTKNIINEAEEEAKRRASGKKKMMSKKKGPALRSGKKGAHPKESEGDLGKLIDESLKNTNDLALNVFGPRKGVLKHLDELKQEAKGMIDEIIANTVMPIGLLNDSLDFLSKLEKEKENILKNMSVYDPIALIEHLKEKKEDDIKRLKDLGVLAEGQQQGFGQGSGSSFKEGEKGIDIGEKEGDEGVKIGEKVGDEGIKIGEKVGDEGIKIGEKEGDEGVKIGEKEGDEGIKIGEKETLKLSEESKSVKEGEESDEIDKDNKEGQNIDSSKIDKNNSSEKPQGAEESRGNLKSDHENLPDKKTPDEFGSLRKEIEDLEHKADEAFPKMPIKDTRDATEKLALFLKSYPEVEKDIKSKTDELLSALLNSSNSNIQKLTDEQKFARSYLNAIPEVVGNPEQAEKAKSLVNQSLKLEQNPENLEKLNTYMNLRLEESKLMSGLTDDTEKLKEKAEEIKRKLLENLENSLKALEDSGKNDAELAKKLAETQSSLESLKSSQSPHLREKLNSLGETLRLLDSIKSLEDDKIAKEIQKIEGKTKDLVENTFKGLLNVLSPEDQKTQEEIQALQKFADEITKLPGETSSQNLEKIDKRLDLLGEQQKQNAELLDKITKESFNKNKEISDLKNLIRQLENQNSDLENSNKALQEKNQQDSEKALKELEDLKSQLEKIATDLYDKTNELNNLYQQIQENEDKIFGLENDLAKKQELLEKLESENEKKLKELENLNNQLKLAEEQKQAKDKEISDQLSKISNLENLAKTLADSNGSNEALIKDLEKNADDLDKARAENADLAKRLEKVLKDLADLKNAAKKIHLRELCKIFREKQGKLFRILANYTTISIKIIDSPEEDISDEELEERQLKNEYKLADELLDEENKILIETNPIMISYKQIEVKTEKPMTYTNVFKFLEELMDKKFETDKKDIKDLRLMRSMTEFMMENLQRQFGIQSLALKFLGQFIPGFYQIYSDGHKYGIFFARLLQLFHPEPVPYSLALYIVKVRKDFQVLIDNFERVMHDQGKTKELKKGAETFGKSAYEAAGTGGLALVADAIEFVYTIFAGDRESGTKALELIRPDNITQEDFVLFKICHKMAKLGETPELIFCRLDKDGGGTISIKEFIEGTKIDLDLWITDASIAKLLKQIDMSESGEITEEAFMNKINMKLFATLSKSPNWTVPKSTFLISLIDVYKFNQRKLAAHLNQSFSKFSKQFLDKEEFEELLMSYEPWLSPYDIDKLYNEALLIGNSAPGASFKAINTIMCKYGFSYLKSFRIKELLGELSLRKSIVDVSLAPTESAHIKAKSTNFEEEKKTPTSKKSNQGLAPAVTEMLEKSPRSGIPKRFPTKK